MRRDERERERRKKGGSGQNEEYAPSNLSFSRVARVDESLLVAGLIEIGVIQRGC